MKLIRFFLLLVALSLVLVSNSFTKEKPSQENLTFKERTFGGTEFEEGKYILETSDGGYILLGITNSFGSGDNDIYVVRTDKSGNKVWDKTFGGKDKEEGNAIEKIDSGGYIIVGSTKSFGAGKSDIYLIKIDEDGNKVWDKTFGTEGSEYGRSLGKTSDGGFIIFGTYLIKLDKDCEEEWKRTYAETSIIDGYSASQTLDGGYILIGAAKLSGFERRRINIAKVDSEGFLTEGWPKTLVMVNGDRNSSIIQASDGSYIILSGTVSFSENERDIYIAKLDPKGKKLWKNTFGGDKFDRGSFILQTSDNGLIFTGFTWSKGAGKADMLVVKMTAVGKVQWEKTFGGVHFDMGNHVRETSDGGFVLIGNTQSFGSGKSDFYLIKLDKDGNVM